MANSGNVFFVFLMYSSAMLILPLFTFFSVKNILEKDFNITGFTNTAWSVICAVIVVNFIIMAYAWRAFKQEVNDEILERNSSSSSLSQIPGVTKSDLNVKKDD